MGGMVEKVARAIAWAHCRAGAAALGPTGIPLQWRDHVEIVWPLHVYEARQAIEAMSEPTEAMIDAGGAPDGPGDYSTADIHYRLMIAAALQEKTP